MVLPIPRALMAVLIQLISYLAEGRKAELTPVAEISYISPPAFSRGILRMIMAY